MQSGTRFEGPSKTLTDAHFLLFSGITGDVHPIHYDVEYAKATRFEKPVAHGLLLTSLMALGASDGRNQLEGMVMVEQGSQFLKPVMVGDTVQAQFVLHSTWDDGPRRFCRFETTLVNHRGETLVKGFHVYRIVRQAREETEHG